MIKEALFCPFYIQGYPISFLYTKVICTYSWLLHIYRHTSMIYTIPLQRLQFSSDHVLKQNKKKYVFVPVVKIFISQHKVLSLQNPFIYSTANQISTMCAVYKEEPVQKIPRVCPSRSSFSISPLLSQARKMFLKQSQSLPVFIKSKKHFHQSHLLQ